MYKVFTALILAALIYSCSDEFIETKRSNEAELGHLSSDPVILYYSKFGMIERAPSGFQNSNCPECVDHDGIYFFKAFSGPLSGQTVEVFRYKRKKDIPSPCDETFTLEKRVHSYENHESVSCPVDGNDCKYVEASGRCLMIFCDETN